MHDPYSTNERQEPSRPDYLQVSSPAPQREVLSWYRPAWAFIGFYAAVLAGSIACFAVLSPWPEAVLDESVIVWQLAAVVCCLVGAWGLAGASMNRERVIIDRDYIARITKPLQLFDRKVAYPKSEFVEAFVEEQVGNVADTYQVSLLKRGGGACPLVVAYDQTAADFVAFRVDRALIHT